MITENSTALTEFEQYLEKQSTIRPNQKPYYIKWVKMYLGSNGLSENNPKTDAM